MQIFAKDYWEIKLLGINEIKKYFDPAIWKINPKGMLVEYLQYEFLDSLFKFPGSEKLSFIGGTAIRLIYNSPRFSEDLDFDNLGLDYINFKHLVEKANEEMRRKGFQLETRFLKKGDAYHCYIKFPDLLFNLALSSHKDEKIFISIDAERKRTLAKPEIKVLNKFGLFRNIPINPAAVLLSQKLLAILYRKRAKGRDFFDASFLAGIAKPDYQYLSKRTGLSPDKFKQKATQHCATLNFKALAKDIEPLLFNPEDSKRVLFFKDHLLNIL